MEVLSLLPVQHSVFPPHTPPRLPLAPAVSNAIEPLSQIVEIPSLRVRQAQQTDAVGERGLAVPHEEFTNHPVEGDVVEARVARGEFRGQLKVMYFRGRPGKTGDGVD